MSRLKKFTRSLFSSYIMLAANTVYSLASVPLALHYLGKAEFGLWALVSNIGSFILLVDMGMSTSVARILIDHKDDRNNGVYGSVIKTGALVGLVQGFLIVAVGTTLALLAGPLLKVRPDQHEEFIWVMLGQVVLLAINFAARIFGQVLFAHQRLDISNYGSAVTFFMTLTVMWLGFASGLGIYSFLMGQAVMVAVGIAVNVVGCIRLRLLPGTGEWGAVNRARFKELFMFSQGIFLISVGGQIINASQVILLQRLLGVEAVVIWTVCTRAYSMITMLVWRVLDYSAPALSEMVVRGERDRLLVRVRDITVLMAGLSVLCGTIFAAANGSFSWLLSHGTVGWPLVNNVLLALWLFACSVMKVQTGLVGITKDLRFLRFIYLLEGSVFVGLNLLFYRWENMTLMLAISLACTLTFTLPYGWFRTRKFFQMSWRDLPDWLNPTWRLIWRLVPVALATWWLAQNLPPPWQFAVDIIVPGIWGTACLLRYGLGRSLQVEIVSKLPSSVQLAVRRVVGV